MDSLGFDKMLTVSETAGILSISKGQVYKMINEDDDFPAVKFGKAIRIPETALHRWLNKQMAGFA